MNASALTIGTHLVRHPERPEPFMLSVIEGTGLKAVGYYELGGKPPRRGRHLLLTQAVRDWLEQLRPA